MLGDEVDRHIGVKPGEVGLELPETWSFAELVRLFGEEAFLVRNEHARPQPLEGRETMVETISGRPGRIGNVAPAAKVPFADMRGVIAGTLEQPRDVGQPRIEPVGLSDRPIIGPVADIVDEDDQIGRASWRDRGGKYGEHPGVAVALKQKNR